MIELLLPPNHLINHSGITLDELYDLGADVLVSVGRYWNAVVTVLDHFYCNVYRLKEVMLIDAGEDEATFVEGLGTFC